MDLCTVKPQNLLIFSNRVLEIPSSSSKVDDQSFDYQTFVIQQVSMIEVAQSLSQSPLQINNSQGLIHTQVEYGEIIGDEANIG